ncbi:MAG: phosphohydrolase [Candidatus Heimdallarchaeota archaeon]|nr:phosphohydrolase [Candidatus Heimdallarchaeota archaeon]
MFIRQNEHHKYGVLLHTLKVVYHVFQMRLYRMVPAAFLHDISKPFVAYQKPEDIPVHEYSFTDHEEASFKMIEHLKGLGKYTKNLVRCHYLLRDMSKCLKRNQIDRYTEKKGIWDNLPVNFQQDLKRFQKCDDAAKK